MAVYISVNYSHFHADAPAIEVTFDDLVSMFAPSKRADTSGYIVTYLLGKANALDEMGNLRHPSGRLAPGESVVVHEDATFQVIPHYAEISNADRLREEITRIEQKLAAKQRELEQELQAPHGRVRERSEHDGNETTELC